MLNFFDWMAKKGLKVEGMLPSDSGFGELDDLPKDDDDNKSSGRPARTVGGPSTAKAGRPDRALRVPPKQLDKLHTNKRVGLLGK